MNMVKTGPVGLLVKTKAVKLVIMPQISVLLVIGENISTKELVWVTAHHLCLVFTQHSPALPNVEQ